MTFKAVQDLFRGYVQELEMMALCNDLEVKRKAAVGLRHMLDILQALHVGVVYP